MADNTIKLFFELIKIAVGNQKELSKAPSDDEWSQLLYLAKKQTLIGICFSAIEQLPVHQRPPKDIILTWFALTNRIEKRNHVMNQRTQEAVNFFRNKGFKAVVLKGQGIGQLYLVPERRISGDIDIWLDGGRKRIYEFARQFDKDGKLYGVNYHHVHFHLFEDVEVEVHIYPSYMKNPFLNHRLHQFCKQYPPSNDSMTPSLAFNRVFILLHCFDHLTGHGVGLRQVMDYYHVLKQGFTEEEKLETLVWLKKLHLTTFAAAMMWVMKEVFGLEDEYLLLAPNEKEGRFLLEEICHTGNMGHYDERHWGSLKTPFSRFLYNIHRDTHFVMHYPQEVLWQPLFNIYLYTRRLFKGLNH